jgi:hypothetical protein
MAVMIDGSGWWMYVYKVFSKLTYDLVIRAEPCHKSGSVCKLKFQVLMTCTVLSVACLV